MAFIIRPYEDIYRLKAIIRKKEKEKRIREIAKGNYESDEDKMARYIEEISGFFFRIGGERIWQFEANQQLLEYKTMFFNRNDTRLAFAQMFVTLKAFHKHLRLFEVSDKSGNKMFFKVIHLSDTEGYSMFQRISSEDAEVLLSAIVIPQHSVTT